MPMPFPSMTPLDCLSAMASAKAPVLLDIRLPEDVADAPLSLPTAHRVAHDDLAAQVALAQGRGAIVICHRGQKLSAGACARLLARGIPAWRLSGGQVGWDAHGLPLTASPLASPLAHDPARVALALDATGDETFAAWAFLRFTDPKAELLEVPRDDLPGVRDRFAAHAPDGHPPPALPGLARLRGAVAAPASVFALLLAGAARPSDGFATLDLAYRGALRHGSVTPVGQAGPTDALPEFRP